MAIKKRALTYIFSATIFGMQGASHPYPLPSDIEPYFMGIELSKKTAAKIKLRDYCCMLRLLGDAIDNLEGDFAIRPIPWRKLKSEITILWNLFDSHQSEGPVRLATLLYSEILLKKTIATMLKHRITSDHEHFLCIFAHRLYQEQIDSYNLVRAAMGAATISSLAPPGRTHLHWITFEQDWGNPQCLKISHEDLSFNYFCALFGVIPEEQLEFAVMLREILDTLTMRHSPKRFPQSSLRLPPPLPGWGGRGIAPAAYHELMDSD